MHSYPRVPIVVAQQAQLGRFRAGNANRRYVERNRPEALDLPLVPAQSEEHDALDTSSC